MRIGWLLVVAEIRVQRFVAEIAGHISRAAEKAEAIHGNTVVIDRLTPRILGFEVMVFMEYRRAPADRDQEQNQHANRQGYRPHYGLPIVKVMEGNLDRNDTVLNSPNQVMFKAAR